MEKITMKKFKEELNGKKSWFGIPALNNSEPIISNIERWFSNFSEPLENLPLRNCVAKSNRLIFTDVNIPHESSYLYFDGKEEKRNFYTESIENNTLYLMECITKYGYLYMGYIISK